METADMRWKYDAMINSILTALATRWLERDRNGSIFRAHPSTLDLMTDHALKDIGLSRTDLPAIAANFHNPGMLQESGKDPGRLVPGSRRSLSGLLRVQSPSRSFN